MHGFAELLDRLSLTASRKAKLLLLRDYMRATPDPVGPGNDADIRRAARWADQVICAWGMHGGLHDRGREVRDLLHRQGIALLHLGLTRGGAPRHPLYLPRHRQAIPWD